jgi:hypothetical protein
LAPPINSSPNVAPGFSVKAHAPKEPQRESDVRRIYLKHGIYFYKCSNSDCFEKRNMQFLHKPKCLICGRENEFYEARVIPDHTMAWLIKDLLETKVIQQDQIWTTLSSKATGERQEEFKLHHRDCDCEFCKNIKSTTLVEEKSQLPSFML